MSTPDAMKDYLLGHFQEELIGTLTSGIIHNINGPLQILSMQIEFFKRHFCEDIGHLQELLKEHHTEATGIMLKKLLERCAKGEERVVQMEETLSRMHRMLDILGRHADMDRAGPRPFYLDQLVEEELEFLKADLFFKHSVITDFVCQSRPFLIESRECEIRDILDAMLVTCIGQLKQGDQKKLRISIEGNNDAGWRCAFEHTGTHFPAFPPGEIPIGTENMDFPGLALFVAQKKAAALGLDLAVQPDCLALKGTSKN